MPHTFKAGKTELSVSNARLVRHADRMFSWSSERRALAVEAAKARLGGKRPTKRDAAIALAGGMVGNGEPAWPAAMVEPNYYWKFRAAAEALATTGGPLRQRILGSLLSMVGLFERDLPSELHETFRELQAQVTWVQGGPPTKGTWENTLRGDVRPRS